jgi:hypothetical protein
VYDVTTDEQSQPQVDALPADALAPFAEARTALEVAPWSGEPINNSYPDAPVRTLSFGPDHEGLVAYLIIENLRRVDILKVFWLD